MTDRFTIFYDWQANTSANGVFESKMSDIVRGTAKTTVSAGTCTSPATTPTPPSSNRASTATDVTASETEVVCSRDAEVSVMLASEEVVEKTEVTPAASEPIANEKSVKEEATVVSKQSPAK